MHRTHTRWRTRIENVARLQGKELRDIGNDLIHPIEHIRGTALLHRLPVDIQMEVDALDIQELLLPSKPLQMVQGCPASEAFFCRSRAVKSMPTVTAS